MSQSDESIGYFALYRVFRENNCADAYQWRKQIGACLKRASVRGVMRGIFSVVKGFEYCQEF